MRRRLSSRVAAIGASIALASFGRALETRAAQDKASGKVCAPACMLSLRGGCCPVPALEPTEPPAGDCPDVGACGAACDKGDAKACTRAGWLSRRAPAGPDRDTARAFAYLDKGCALGDCRACWHSCERERGDYEGLPDFEAALARDESDCQAGDPNSCRKVATLHHLDDRYAGYEQRACDLGSADACADLAEHYAHMRPSPPLPAGTYHKLRERACALGQVRSCNFVGYWNFREPIAGLAAAASIQEQAKQGSALLESLCRRGEASTCETIGEAYDELGQKPEAPPGFAALGLKYLDHACSMRDAEGCRLLGVARLRAQAFTGDTRAAAIALQKACSLGSGRGCVALSQITHDKRQAQELIDRACDHGERGLMGIYKNAGMPELPQPLNCSRPRGARPRR